MKRIKRILTMCMVFVFMAVSVLPASVFAASASITFSGNTAINPIVQGETASINITFTSPALKSASSFTYDVYRNGAKITTRTVALAKNVTKKVESVKIGTSSATSYRVVAKFGSLSKDTGTISVKSLAPIPVDEKGNPIDQTKKDDKTTTSGGGEKPKAGVDPEKKPYTVGSGNTIGFKGGIKTTDSLTVTLTLKYSSSMDEVLISNHKDLKGKKQSNGKWDNSGWIKLKNTDGSFKTEIPDWKLLDGKAGSRTVYAVFRNNGKIGKAYSATIKYTGTASTAVTTLDNPFDIAKDKDVIKNLTFNGPTKAAFPKVANTLFFYTTDGSRASNLSTKWNETPFEISKSQFINVIAFTTDGKGSNVVVYDIKVVDDAKIPSGDPIDAKYTVPDPWVAGERAKVKITANYTPGKEITSATPVKYGIHLNGNSKPIAYRTVTVNKNKTGAIEFDLAPRTTDTSVQFIGSYKYKNKTYTVKSDVYKLRTSEEPVVDPVGVNVTFSGNTANDSVEAGKDVTITVTAKVEKEQEKEVKIDVKAYTYARGTDGAVDQEDFESAVIKFTETEPFVIPAKSTAAVTRTITFSTKVTDAGFVVNAGQTGAAASQTATTKIVTLKSPIVDAQKPVMINYGVGKIFSRLNVPVKLTPAKEYRWVRMGEDPTLSDAKVWLEFKPEMKFTFKSMGDGEKTLFVQFGHYNNEKSTIEKDVVTLDESVSKNALTIVINGPEATTTPSNKVNVKLRYNKNYKFVSISEDKNKVGEKWLELGKDITNITSPDTNKPDVREAIIANFELSGTTGKKTLYARFAYEVADSKPTGNISGLYYDEITYNDPNFKPLTATMTIGTANEANPAETRSRVVFLYITASADLKQMRYAGSEEALKTKEYMDIEMPRHQVELANEDPTTKQKTVFIQFRDKDGKETGVISDSIKINPEGSPKVD